MALKSILCFGLFASLAVSQATRRQPTLCEVGPQSEELRIMAESAMANLTDFTAAAGETITIPTYFHVLAKGRSLEEGYLTVGAHLSLPFIYEAVLTDTKYRRT